MKKTIKKSVNRITTNFKKAPKAFHAGLVILLVAGIFMFLKLASAAGNGVLSLSPSSGSRAVGSTFTVSVYEDSGSTEIGTVEANVQFSSSVQYISSAKGTYFDICVRPTVTASTVSFGCTMQGANTAIGKQLVGTITFQAKTSGTSTLTFASSSSIIQRDPIQNIWNTNPAGATYTFGTCQTGYTGTYPNCVIKPPSDGGGGSGGGSGSGGSTSVTPKRSITPSPTQQKADPAAAVPASTSSDANSLYLVAIKVVDGKNHVVNGAAVTLGSHTAKTDITGIASFSDITAGSYKVTVKSGNLQGSATVVIDGSQPTSSVQQFEVKIKSRYSTGLFIGIGAIVLIILLGVGLWRSGMLSRIKSRFNKSNKSANSGNTPAVTVVSADHGPTTTPTTIVPHTPSASSTTITPSSPSATSGTNKALNPKPVDNSRPAAGSTITPNKTPVDKP